MQFILNQAVLSMGVAVTDQEAVLSHQTNTDTGETTRGDARNITCCQNRGFLAAALGQSWKAQAYVPAKYSSSV